MILKDKLALITGSSQGIGKAIAEKMAGAGATIAVAALKDEALTKTAAEFKERGIRFEAYGADLTEDAQADRVVRSIARDLGPIDILINNAGITGPTAPVQNVSIEDWDRTLNINLRTPFLLSRLIAPSMIERKTGHIVNISSIAGKMAYPLRTPYASSKWGIIGLTLALAQELGPHNIRVNAVCPGIIDTSRMDDLGREQTWKNVINQMVPLKRPGTDEEVGKFIAYLCTPDASYITGQSLNIDGGVVMW